MPSRAISPMLKFISVFAVATLLPASSFAATDDGNFAARGIGAQSCENLTSFFKGEDKDVVSTQLGAWVAGYITHANRVTPDTYDMMPIQNIYGVATILARICDRNPESLVEPVMNRIVSIMTSFVQSEATPLSVVENDGKEVAIRQAVLMDAQSRLIARGHLESGNDDGVYGPRTREALINFQQSNNLEVTGLPDALTLFVLFDTE